MSNPPATSALEGVAPVPPRVFLSHAGEDKERFVLDFATRLRAKGVDAWLDRWEMLPGDSLVEKIIDEEIANAQAIIVVISLNSVSKPWVQEELNAAVVRRIEKRTPLIPVVIDDCVVPEAVKTIVWEKIPDLDNYNEQLERIVASIFQHREKPPVGDAPRYAALLVSPIGRLSRIDTCILGLFGEETIRPQEFLDFNVLTESVWKRASQKDVPRREFLDSLEILRDEGFLKPSREIGLVPSTHQLTLHGFSKYAEKYLPDFDSLVTAVAGLLVNEDVRENFEIAARLEKTPVLVTLVMQSLERRQLIELHWTNRGRVTAETVKPQLRRLLRDL